MRDPPADAMNYCRAHPQRDPRTAHARTNRNATSLHAAPSHRSRLPLPGHTRRPAPPEAQRPRISARHEHPRRPPPPRGPRVDPPTQPDLVPSSLSPPVTRASLSLSAASPRRRLPPRRRASTAAPPPLQAQRRAPLGREQLPLAVSRRGSPAVRLKMEAAGRDANPLGGYRIGKTLGIGSFGKVKIADHIITNHKVAIKILNRRKIKSMEMEEKVKREIKILRLFMHPHIIRLYEVIDTPADIYVVMEYVKSGELFDYIVEKGRLQEEEARRFFQQIISGVEYCHRNMVVHRDLKPENLLLDSKCNVKIADFGLSNVMRDGHFLKTSCGSPNYAAPEVISGKLYAGPEVDVWSCGVILYALLCGTLPFDDENIPNLFKKIKGGIYTLPSHLSPLARDLIPRMLVVDPMKRITIREIREHSWFKARLPRYLAVPPPDTAQQVKKLDDETLNDVIKMGFDKNQLIESLQKRLQNEATVAYYLLLDNKLRTTSGYLGAEYQESMDLSFSQTSPETPSSASEPRQYGSPAFGLRQHFAAERKWALGLQSRAHPREIITEVLKALQELNVCWKKIGHYNMKCRWNPSFVESMMHNNHGFGVESAIIETDDLSEKSTHIVKFEIQLYKTRDEKYLLDLQRVSGPQLLFLDLCSAFLTQLRVL